jgi:hypothetical protein
MKQLVVGADQKPCVFRPFMKDFMSINYHDTSPILLMWQRIYDEREGRVSSYVRGVSSS